MIENKAYINLYLVHPNTFLIFMQAYFLHEYLMTMIMLYIYLHQIFLCFVYIVKEKEVPTFIAFYIILFSNQKVHITYII